MVQDLKLGKKIVFLRHALAPGNGDPYNFDINDCKTQRNLSSKGRLQSEKIGNFFKINNIKIIFRLAIIVETTVFLFRRNFFPTI